MDEQQEASVFEKDPNIVKLKRALEDEALAYLVSTRGKDFWDVYRPKLSEAGNLLYKKDGKESDKKPSHLIMDPAIYKILEENAREALGKTVE